MKKLLNITALIFICLITYTNIQAQVVVSPAFHAVQYHHAFKCGDNITFTYNGTEVTYGTVESLGKCWLDRNLGATQVATSSTDANAYGDLFQWGRGDDGHQNISIASVFGQSSLTTPTGGQAGKFLRGYSNWYNGSNPNDLWQGVSGTNNPCPSGWRVPTEAEWNTERISWAPNNNPTGAINSPLKLPLAGYRHRGDGSLFSVGSSGFYWSSSVDGAGSRRLYLVSGNADVNSFDRAFGYSIRCLKDCPLPEQATQGTHTPSETQIIWNWNTSVGADGYKYNTVNNYATATDNGASTSYTQEGLDCGTTYILYVWAYNDCGTSAAVQFNQFFDNPTECPCGIATVTFTDNGTEVTYGTVESEGKCWLDRNLGATQVATSSADANAYGDLFQWGRGDDGHQNRSIASVSGQSSLTTPTGGQAGKFLHGYSNWYNGSNPDDLWQGVSGTNNPCPIGWRVPTEAEWNTERLSWAPNNNATGAINSPLKLPLAGYRSYSNGSLVGVGYYGDYWSSSVDGAYSRRLGFGSGNAMGSLARAFGFSLRCIKN